MNHRSFLHLIDNLSEHEYGSCSAYTGLGVKYTILVRMWLGFCHGASERT